MALGSLFLFSYIETTIIIADIKRKQRPILSRKGMPGVRNLNPIESGIANMTPINAALVEVRFQNSPKTKMAKTPGLINPILDILKSLLQTTQ